MWQRNSELKSVGFLSVLVGIKGFEINKSDNSQVILTADKAVDMVVLNKHDYINKAENLSEQGDTYKTLITDPSIKRRPK